ncbi:MAG: T9SS type A sorting domain-containing protein, partial [Rubricoccaceae bacterium]|nr:T9SS type A sorting domain-containing protein [Rubricoccaceae bacterium]
LSPGGPYLWTSGREEIGFESRGVYRQFSPSIGAFTGVEIEMINRSPYALDIPVGCSFTGDLDDETITLIGLQAGSMEPLDSFDWIVVYDADLVDSPIQGPEITVSPTAIDVEVQQGDSLEIPVFIGNTGDINLTWDAYVENVDANSEGELGDVLSSVDISAVHDSTGSLFNSATFARDHFWVSGYDFPDDKWLYKFDQSGALVDSFRIGGISNLGWRTITTDGDNIYGSDTYSIAVWSIDSMQVVDNVITNSISPSGLAYDRDNQHFYLSGRIGTIEVFDRDGDEVRLVVTPYVIEGLAWDDLSPGGPFLWAFVDLEAEGCCKAVQLDPVSGVPTGVSFPGVEQGTQPNVPEAATVTRDLIEDRLTLIGLQESEDYQNYEAHLVAYDLDVAPPPAWIDLAGPTVGLVEPLGTDTLTVWIHGMMADTTTAAIIRISSNDLTQPLVTVPVNTDMLGAEPTNTENPQGLPDLFTLEQNYPNPFRPPTRIRFALPQAAEVRFEIYDILGRRITTMTDVFQAGSHEILWNGSNDQNRPAASGVYFYKLSVGDRSQTRRMLLLR